jgi:hypothetical protein
MTVSYTPPGLDAALDKVRAASLRALPANALNVLENLNRGEIGTQQLADLLMSDPVLAWRLFHDIGSQLRQRSTITLNGIGHCLALGGMERATRLLQSSPVLDDGSMPAEGAQGYRQAMVTCLFAARLADDWQRLVPQLNHDQMCLAALLQHLPEAALWQQAPELMRIIDHLVRVAGLPHGQAEQLVLGCEMHDLALGLARSARMSDQMQSALNSNLIPTPGFLMRWSRKMLRKMPGTIEYRDESIRKPEISTALRVSLANLVALEARRDWHGRGMRRCLKLVAAYLQLKEQDAWIRIRNLALTLARTLPDPETASLAAGLFCDAVHTRRQRFTDEELLLMVDRLSRGEPVDDLGTRPSPRAAVITPVAAPAGKPPDTAGGPPPARGKPPLGGIAARPAAPREQPKPGFPSLEKQHLFEQHLARLTGRAPGFALAQEIIRSGVDVLKACTTLDRVLLGLVNLNKDHIISYYAAGCESSPSLKRYEIKLSPPNLFTRLVKQPSCIWLSPEKHKATIGWIPGYFRQAIDVEEFFAATLFSARGPIALLYADKGVQQTAMRESDFIAFRLLANATNQALAGMHY